MITKEQKAEVVKKFGGENANTGKAEVQIAIHTLRILDLTQHLSTHKKDNHCRRGLIKLVSKRRKLLDYLADNHIERYRSVLAELKLRK